MAQAPPIACSLTSEELPQRLSQAEDLGAGLVDVETRGERALLHFRSDRATRAAVDAFIAAESKCCPFFSFETAEQSDTLSLAIEAPAEGAPLLRGLVAGIVAGWELPS
jgi:MerR family transcriptional regulator, copper efflux regulator